MASDFMDYIERKFSPEKLKGHPTRKEMFMFLDVSREMIAALHNRLKAVEEKTGDKKNGKARVRVPAGRQQA